MKYNVKANTARDKKEFVSGIITNKQGNVLILKRRQDLSLDPGKYDLCSGHIKVGEAPMQAMLRELREEIGFKAEHINLIESIGIIETPHKDFSETLCHIYNIETDLEVEKINQMIHKVEEPEMEEAIFLDSIEELRKMQKNTNNLRLKETKQFNIVLEVLERKIKMREENKGKVCEER